jgi:N-acetylmuramic acid 6-phosphate etherase
MRETERRRADTLGIDLLETPVVVSRLTGALADVPAVVARAAPATAQAVDATRERLLTGGRLAYAGSGTPGWLVDADAAELAPTFGFPAERLIVIRGRSAAALGGAPDEDHPERGEEAVAAAGLAARDVLVSVAASGSTPFTCGAARRAAASGALTIAVANVPNSELASICDISVELGTGGEPITGSTRMRAGLAQRMWLTVFSTAVMVRLGLTHDNLMVNVAPVVDKLRERRTTILAEVTGQDRAQALHTLEAAGDDLRVAIVASVAGVDRESAEHALQACRGRTRAAIDRARGG